MKRFALNLFVVGSLLTSCSSNDDDNTKDGELMAPSSYQFIRNGSTTVSYDVKTDEILMAEEFISALIDNSKTETELDGMFTNTGNYFSTAELNESNLNLRSKTAASNDYFSNNTTVASAIKSDFDGWIAKQVNEVFPNWSNAAAPGESGKIQELGAGNATLYVNAKGLEYNRMMNKTLIGAVMTDQILNNYLSVSVLDAGNARANNDAGILDGSNNYTTMEHNWDQAFGYVYGTDNALAPQLNQDRFLNQYVQRVDRDTDFEGVAQEIYDAFKLGRAAVVAKKYDIRNQQAEIIRENISKIIGIRTVFYLQLGENKIVNDYGEAFHHLSEGVGFIYSLQFTRKPGTSVPYFTKSEVDDLIAQLMENNGLWDVTSETLNSISSTIADRFGFTVEQARNN